MDFRRWMPFLIANILISVVSVSLVLWVAGGRNKPTVLVVTATPAVAVPTTAGVVTGDSLAPQPTATPQPPANVQTYEIQSGDMISSIAEQYGLTIEEVIAANPQLPNPDRLEVGQQIFIPLPGAAAQPTEAAMLQATTAANPASTPIPTIAVPVNNGPVTLTIQGVEGVGDVANERVLLTNKGKEAVDLKGWALQTPSGAKYNFPALRLFPGGQIAIFSGVGTDSVTNFYWQQPSAMWGSGQVVSLFSPDGAIHTTYGIP